MAYRLQEPNSLFHETTFFHQAEEVLPLHIVIVHAIRLTGPRRPRSMRHGEREDFRVSLEEPFVEGPLAHARGAGDDDRAAVWREAHSCRDCVLAWYRRLGRQLDIGRGGEGREKTCLGPFCAWSWREGRRVGGGSGLWSAFWGLAGPSRAVRFLGGHFQDPSPHTTLLLEVR